MIHNKTVAFLGAGSMAEAMIAGIVQNGQLPKEQVIATNHSNKEKRDALQAKYGIRTMQNSELPFDQVDVFILAMKPKDAEAALKELSRHTRSDQLVLSVMAGISCAKMEQWLNREQPVIRVMPNTSSIVGESATAVSKGTYATDEHVETAVAILESIGQVYVIDESKMDVFTGIAGSGPAYIYFLMEHIEKAAEEAGMPAEEAREIGAQMIFGAAKMMMTSEDTPAELRKKITSPNGTTQAGLEALASFGGGEAIYQAVQHAAKRSAELNKS